MMSSCWLRPQPCPHPQLVCSWYLQLRLKIPQLTPTAGPAQLLIIAPVLVDLSISTAPHPPDSAAGVCRPLVRKLRG
jgi:hypothetical protein